MEIEIGNTKVQRIKVYEKDYQAFKTNIPQALITFLELDEHKRIRWLVNVRNKKVTLVFVDAGERNGGMCESAISHSRRTKKQ